MEVKAEAPPPLRENVLPVVRRQDFKAFAPPAMIEGVLLDTRRR